MQFFLGLALSFVIASVVWSAMIIYQMGAPVTGSYQWVDRVYRYKEHQADQIQEQKVAIVSGSNAFFGFDSIRLASEWEMPVFNGAVYAGLTLHYILDRSKRILRAGDIVLLPLEYQYFQRDSKPTQKHIDFVLSWDPEYFWRAPLLDQFWVLALVSKDRIFEGIEQKRKRVKGADEDVTVLNKVNRLGDRIHIDPENMSDSDRRVREGVKPSQDKGSKLSGYFVSTMDAYLSWAREHGICVVAMPASRRYFVEYTEGDFPGLYKEIDQYYQSRNVDFVGHPLDYLYPKELFFNTQYHLNKHGVEMKTNQVLEDIATGPRQFCH